MLIKFFKEPLLHFLVIGAGLFLFFAWQSGPASMPSGPAGTESARVVVTQDDIRQMVETFTRTWQRPPTEEEVEGLMESFVRDEIYYREAVAAGLDRDDSVIRRRLRLKMEYIFEDIAAQGEPTEADLDAYFKKHASRYLVEPQIGFHQVFVSLDKRGKDAQTYASKLLAQLNNGADAGTLGDPTLLERKAGLLYLWEIRNQFGERFTESLLALEPGSWKGPVRSEFGLHLVFIEDRREGRLPELHEVLESVKLDWAAERQRKLKDAAYARFREQYEVIVEKPENATGAEVAAADQKTVTR